jgi:hypothetical protein
LTQRPEKSPALRRLLAALPWTDQADCGDGYLVRESGQSQITFGEQKLQVRHKHLSVKIHYFVTRK